MFFGLIFIVLWPLSTQIVLGKDYAYAVVVVVLEQRLHVNYYTKISNCCRRLNSGWRAPAHRAT